MALHVTARFLARPEARAALLDILGPLVAPIRQDPGCLRCHFTQSLRDPNEFLFIEEWQSHAALDRHLGDAYVTRAIEACTPLLSEPVELLRFEPLP